jgi:hypothetical protein
LKIETGLPSRTLKIIIHPDLRTIAPFIASIHRVPFRRDSGFILSETFNIGIEVSIGVDAGFNVIVHDFHDRQPNGCEQGKQDTDNN